MSSMPGEAAERECRRRWLQLSERLGERFYARPRGFLAAEYRLTDHHGEEFGSLRLRGLEGAGFEAGRLAASMEATGGASRRYRMVEGGDEVLSSRPARGGGEEVHSLGEIYGVEYSLLRNRATARQTGDPGEVRVEGGLASRGYEVVISSENGAPALPVAIFLLYRTAALRRRVYLARRT